MNIVYGARRRARGPVPHSVEVRQVYQRVLAGSSVRSRHLEVSAGNRVHLLDKGAGPPLVLLPGGASFAAFFLPLLNELEGSTRWPPTGPGRS